METTNKEVILGDRMKGQIDLPKIDVSKFIGTKTKIESVKTMEGQFGFYVLVESEILEKIEGGKEEIILRASKILNLSEDKDGNIGWGLDTKTDKFLKKYGVKHYDELKGKEIIVQTRTTDKGEFLSFE